MGDTAVHRLNEGQLAVWRGKTLGVIFQFFQLLPTLTLLENVMLPMDFCGIGTMAERRERAHALLAQVEMPEHAHKLPSACSGGQQQRVAIARALANHPQVILADEPTGNLHLSQGREIMELFKTLNAGGTTIIQVTHSEQNAAYGHRIVELADGWVVNSAAAA